MRSASGGSAPGSCTSGKTKVALPSSAVDQQTLISILPHITFKSAGVGGKPTIRFSGVNVQVVSGSGSTAGAVNGEGNVAECTGDNIFIVRDGQVQTPATHD